MSHRILNIGMALLVGLALYAGTGIASDQRSWSNLTGQERAALAPLAADWDRFPADQQQRLLLVAKRYPSLTPQQQHLLQKRLRSWSKLTPEQRQAARQNLSRIQTLPETDQAKIKQRWLDALCKEFDPQDSHSAGK